MPVYCPNLDIASNRSWDLPLIADVFGEKSKYTPNSDASLRINKFPHLVVEVASNDKESDRYRMLLQAACLARLGRVLRQSSAPPVIVSAVYINNELSAEWHLVYQPRADVPTVGLILQRLLTTYVSAG